MTDDDIRAIAELLMADLLAMARDAGHVVLIPEVLPAGEVRPDWAGWCTVARVTEGERRCRWFLRWHPESAEGCIERSERRAVCDSMSMPTGEWELAERWGG